MSASVIPPTIKSIRLTPDKIYDFLVSRFSVLDARGMTEERLVEALKLHDVVCSMSEVISDADDLHEIHKSIDFLQGLYTINHHLLSDETLSDMKQFDVSTPVFLTKMVN